MSQVEEVHNAFHGVVLGRVQGVGFRVFAREAATEQGVTGWVRNLAGGNVEVYAEGDEMQLTEFLTDLYRGPIMAHVIDIKLQWKTVPAPTCKSFDILR
jgi:acylphosphatase